MKQLTSEYDDLNTLQELGRASVQVVHDLKNQLNGLKLYATFLRKRIEKSERPADEQETITKLIAGLERAAADMNVLVRLGRPAELRRQANVDLGKLIYRLIHEQTEPIAAEVSQESIYGNFDTAALTEALKVITAGALLRRSKDSTSPLMVRLRLEGRDGIPAAVIEWVGLNVENGSDPFHSFVGSEGIRMSLASKLVAAHGGEASRLGEAFVVRLPLADEH
jgi:signal transduction histidine kinase